MIWQWVVANWHKIGVLVLVMKEFKVVFHTLEQAKKGYAFVCKLLGKKVIHKELCDDEKDAIVRVLISTPEGRAWIIDQAKKTGTMDKLGDAINQSIRNIGNV